MYWSLVGSAVICATGAAAFLHLIAKRIDRNEQVIAWEVEKRKREKKRKKELIEASQQVAEAAPADVIEAIAQDQ